MSDMFAVIRLRGPVNVNKDLEDTMRMLRLTATNHCIIVKKSPSQTGMLKKVENFITWGEIRAETLEKLLEKRGRLPGDKRLDAKQAKAAAQDLLKGKDAGIKNIFRLSPPKKGMKSVRSLYPRGDLGYRGDKINELLDRMI
jgi:large subunit ribosomal protein L30